MQNLIVLIVIALPILLFVIWFSTAITITHIDHMRARGNDEGAYRFGLKLLRFVQVSGIVLMYRTSVIHILVRLSQLAETQGDIDLAIEYMKRAMDREQNPTFRSVALQQIALLLRQQNKIGEATQLENEALAITLQRPEPQLLGKTFIPIANEVQHCNLLISQGKLSQALAAINSSLPSANSISTIYFRRERAVALGYQGKYDEAIASQQGLDALLEAFKKAKRPYGYNLGTISLPTSWKFNELYCGEFLFLISLCLKAGQFGAASEYWEKLFGKTTSTAVRAYYVATNAWFCAAIGDEEKAFELIEELYEIPPRSSVYQIPTSAALAQAFIALREYEPASQIFTDVLKDVSDLFYQAEYRTLLADCYLKMEQPNEARELYEQVVAAGFEEAAFTKRAQTALTNLRAQEALFNQPLVAKAGM